MTAEPTLEGLREVASFAAIFAAPAFVAGDWLPTALIFAQSEPLSRFVATTYERGAVLSFDWPSFGDEAARIEADPALLSCADLLTVRKLLTIHIRADRFSDGHLAGAIRDGRLVRLLERLGELVAEG